MAALPRGHRTSAADRWDLPGHGGPSHALLFCPARTGVSAPHGLCYTPAVSDQQHLSTGLYLVATPIGNLEDITLRAVRVLKQVDLIACEDTRQTQKLLNHYGIEKPTISYHEHNEASRATELIEKLSEGGRIAVVSDAGTPGINDPGFRLGSLAIERGIPVIPIPGAAAFVSALVASGLSVES